MLKWKLAYKKKGQLFDTTSFKEIPCGKYSQADPFLIDDYIFFEQFNQVKGVISYYKIGDWKSHLALERYHHLSYPQVFKHEDAYYLLPEAGTTQKITLYKAKKFPNKWEPYKTLYKGIIYSDPTLYYHGSFWYLFFTSPGDNDLTILKSDSLEGEFKRHHVGQYIYSRSAGNIFFHKGHLIRPVQDNSKIYGGAIIFKTISLEPYTESILHHIFPEESQGVGLHTYNRNDKWEVIDLKYDTEIHST